MENSARIFDVKHYAVHDGPGIRLTFFLMGCPLRCLWCQNPESWRDETTITLTPIKCIGCGACVSVCGKLDEHLQLPRASCTLCGKCVSACKPHARAFGSKRYTPADVLRAALPEKIFFDASGGGVTFSGGECMLHADFLAETLRLCREAGIHTVVDTCGAAPWSAFEAVLPYTNLFLYDLKLLDNERHFLYTGRGNEEILANLRGLTKAGADVILRIPLIPGHTDAREDIAATGRFIHDELGNRIQRVELLPYNQLAETKYGNHTIWSDGGLPDYPLPGLEPQTPEYVASLAAILTDLGVPVYSESL